MYCMKDKYKAGRRGSIGCVHQQMHPHGANIHSREVSISAFHVLLAVDVRCALDIMGCGGSWRCTYVCTSI